MNKIIVGREREGYHPKKDSSFDILSLADHLHRSQSTTLEGPQLGKIYFLLNPVPDFFAEGLKALLSNVELYNRSLKKNKVLTSTISSYEPGSTLENPLDLDAGSNELSTRCSMQHVELSPLNRPRSTSDSLTIQLSFFWLKGC